MPAITRSQKKMNSTVVENQVTINIVEKPSAEKYKPSDNKVIVSATVNARPIATEQSKSVKAFIKYVNDVCTKFDHYVKAGLYFEQLRILTELYYYIYESFDTILIVNGIARAPNFQRLINTMYFKGVELSTKVKTLTVDKVTTSEEQYITDCFLEQLVQTQTKLELYAKEKRNKKIVDYIGMDTIEPLNEYDAITNIWADETVHEDPDYEYETDEDDDSGEDDDQDECKSRESDEDECDSDESDEDEYESEEDEDESEEDEDESEEESEEFEEHKVASNHIRFVY
jgi:hypothetical protein